MRSRPSPFRLGDHGNAAIEFALVVPVLLLMTIAAIDFGGAFHQRIQLETAVRVGAHQAIDDQTVATIETVVKAATSLTAADLTVTATQFCECSNGATVLCTGTCAAGLNKNYLMTVTASKTYTPIFDWPDAVELPATLDASATVRYQ
ncbi:MAG: pilus assembly protein [Alphaproteobacteria bacterium]|nr:pilus assembly protein [Alphaproteobacteria bacterium]